MKRPGELRFWTGAGLILCLVLGMAAAAGAQENILAFGSAALPKEGAATEPIDAAVEDALRSAMYQALAQSLGQARMETSLPLIARPILEAPHSHILGFQIKSKIQTENRLHVLVEARINPAALKASLTKAGLGRNLKVRVLVLMSVKVGQEAPFTWWLTPDQSPPVSLAYATLIKRLEFLGCEIIETTEKPTQPPGPEPADEDALVIGQQYNAEVALIGRIDESDELTGRTALISARLVEVETGRMLASANEMGGPENPEGVDPTTTTDPAGSGQGSFQKPENANLAGERVAEDLVAQLKRAGWSLASEPRRITITLSGIKRYADMRSFLETLKRHPQHIQNVRQRSIRGGQATFTAMVLTGTRKLADLLLSEDFPDFFLSVDRVEPGELSVVLVPK